MACAPLHSEFLDSAINCAGSCYVIMLVMTGGGWLRKDCPIVYSFALVLCSDCQHNFAQILLALKNCMGFLGTGDRECLVYYDFDFSGG